jgi:hypothetical protein
MRHNAIVIKRGYGSLNGTGIRCYRSRDPPRAVEAYVPVPLSSSLPRRIERMQESGLQRVGAMPALAAKRAHLLSAKGAG